MIAALAARLAANVRSHDLVARHAGNKFALVAAELRLRAAAVRRRCASSTACTAEPFETSAGAMPATIRIGGVIGPRDGRTTQMLFQHAEEALDIARQRAVARFVAYTPSLARGDRRMQALNVAESIVSALDQNRVELALQPVVHAQTATSLSTRPCCGCGSPTARS